MKLCQHSALWTLNKRQDSHIDAKRAVQRRTETCNYKVRICFMSVVADYRVVCDLVCGSKDLSTVSM